MSVVVSQFFTQLECILKQMVEIKAVHAVGACATVKLAYVGVISIGNGSNKQFGQQSTSLTKCQEPT